MRWLLCTFPSGYDMNQNRLFIIFLLCWVASPAAAIEPFYPACSVEQARYEQKQLRTNVADTTQFYRAIRLSRFYIYKYAQEKLDLDSAYSFYIIANNIGNKIATPKCRADLLNLLGAIAHERSDISGAVKLHKQAADVARSVGDLATEAESWYLCGETELSGGLHDSPHYDTALQLFSRARMTERRAYVLCRISLTKYLNSQYDAALRSSLEALKLYKSVRYPRMRYVCTDLLRINRDLGLYTQALQYGLLAIEEARKERDLENLANCYISMGMLYEQLGDLTNAIKYQKECVNVGAGIPNREKVFQGTRYVTNNMMLLGKVKEAGRYFMPLFKAFPAASLGDSLIQMSVWAQYHVFNGELGKAEPIFRALLKHENNPEVYIQHYAELTNLEIGEHYLKFFNWEKARFYVTKAAKRAAGFPRARASISLRIQKAMYLVDSAQGNFAAALEHYRMHRKLSDSLFSAQKSLQIAGIQVQFDVKKKEQDITLLTQRNRIQQERIHNQESQQNAMIGGTVLLSFLLLSVYVQFRNKQKNNLELQQHQLVIEDSNARLTRTVEEKQLLVREIHHRVKNNLQTVISLLESQAFYLENDALAAVKDSQSRIHAMSLIHQKLYLADNVTSINMQAYIEELVAHLSSSHADSSRICIDMQVDPIYLDVAQAIPLGLIINEAVTNIFKYAFPDGMPGQMFIHFNEIPESDYILKVRDNGIGLNAAVDQTRPGSLGMKLMKGLSHEMGGDFSLKSDHGVSITVRFSPLQHYLEAER